MICLASHMPLLRIGHHDVSHYEEGWLERVLRQAAHQAGHEGWWPAGDVARGVWQFLSERFDGNIITLQELFQKVHHTLQTIGFPEIANQVQAEPPPMELCLLELAREADGLEIAFFRTLAHDLGELREIGTTRIEVTNLRAAVLHLAQTVKWHARCRDLESEIVEYARLVIGQTNAGRDIALLLSH